MIDWDKKVLGPTLKVFGELVHYFPSGGESIDISGVFDEAYQGIPSLDGEMVEANTTGPVLGVRSYSFVSEPRQGDQLVIDTIKERYVVRDVRPDGHGHLLLMLNHIGSE
jgi:hypothetical protein